MTTYLVDTENMGLAWMRYVKEARPGDLFLLFYTTNSHSIDFASLKKITTSKAKFECIPCCIGTNALDFQLVTELGFRIAKKPLLDYVVLSKDKGFDAVVSYWQERGIRIERRGVAISVDQEPVKQAAPLPTPKPVNQATPMPTPMLAVPPMLKTYTQKMVAIGIDSQKATKAGLIIQHAMCLPPKKRLGTIYKKILAEFGQKKGLALYQQLKPLLAGINKN